MTTNTGLRGSSSQREEIYDFIDLIALKEKHIKEVEVDINYFQFREILRDYSHNINDPENIVDSHRYSHETMRCFVDAANTKYEVASNFHNWHSKFASSFMSAIGGGCVSSFLGCLVKNTFISWGIIAAGTLGGARLGWSFADNALEQREFADAALECYESIAPAGEVGVAEV